MKPSKFDEIVKARAHERVVSKVDTLKRKIRDALQELTGEQSSVGNPFAHNPKYREVLTQIMKAENENTGWPSYLWERERERVAGELLGVMDEMQKALLSPVKTSETDPTPRE